MYPVETFTSPYSVFLRGTCSYAPCSPLRFGPPKAKIHRTLWAPSKPLLAHIHFFLRGTCSYAPCSPLRFGPPKAKIHRTLWAPSKPLLAHIHFLLTKISDFEISLCLSLLVLLGYVCSLIIKLLTFGKCYLYFDQTPLKVYLHRHNCETLFLHL